MVNIFKKLFLILLLFIGGCKTDWFEKGIDYENQGHYTEAFETFQKGANKGDPSCMWRVARYYEVGRPGIPSDEEKAFQWYQKSAKAGLASSYIDLGHAYLSGRGVECDPNMAIENFLLANAKGDPQGLCELGEMYYEGHGVEKDLKKAFECFRDAASNDCDKAASHLAAMYAKGLYVKLNTQKAEQLFIQLAEQSEFVNKRKSLSMDLYKIGIDFQTGVDIPRDDTLTFHWISMAVEWGYEDGEPALANLYAYGVGVEKDLKKAEGLFKTHLEKCSDQMQYFTHYAMGLFYLQAYDPPAYKKAFESLLKVAEAPNAYPASAASAMAKIGYLYLSGSGVEYDPDKGKEWFDKAVAKYEQLAEYSPKAMWELGLLYDAPYKETKDAEKALYWFQKASDKGWEEAKNKLKELRIKK